MMDKEKIDPKDGYLLIKVMGYIPRFDYQGRPLPSDAYGTIVKGDIPDVIKQALNKVENSFVQYQPLNGYSFGELDIIHHTYIEKVLSSDIL